jgi:hypothetical protein
MSVAALSTAGFSQYIASSSNVGPSQQAWQSLQQSLAQGNLTQAQSAFNTYNQLNQNLASASGSSSSATTQMATDMKALGSAIGSGNLSTAQSAFATVQTDLASTPSQSMTNATAAVAQSVQWVEDLLNLSSSSTANQTITTDPVASILNSVYEPNSTSTTTDPTTAILDSAYGTNGASSTGSTTADSTASVPNNGNIGSGASVNAYA